MTVVSGIDDVKLNKGYRCQKRFNQAKPRLKEADINNLKHYCEPEGVSVEVEGNRVRFIKQCEGANVIINGIDTGGQLIRAMAIIAINSGEGRQTEPLPIQLPKFTVQHQRQGLKGKATMLMVQLVKLTLPVGGSAQFKDGDISNSDARQWKDMPNLFQCLQTVFGLCFSLEDESNEVYTLRRHADVPRDDEIELFVENDNADEIIMTAVVLKVKGVANPKIKLTTPVNATDFHIGAMVKLAKAYGLSSITDDVCDGIRHITIL